ncbi:hypothetical protein BDW59DRAFT_164955 [Aspergillus cavernicola]|uniref:Uncharacterized protein n=1 Tax=Aspergillus cavernicola TaxID=176166 RepID=A0ABR4HY16_9EURO
MVDLIQVISTALLTLPLAVAQAPQVQVYEDRFFEGQSISLPADGSCHSMPEGWANRASSIAMPEGVTCLLSK